MSYDRNADVVLVGRLADLNNDIDAFATGILADSHTPHEQILFALRLVRIAELLKARAEGIDTSTHTEGMVVEGEATTSQTAGDTTADNAIANQKPEHDEHDDGQQ